MVFGLVVPALAIEVTPTPEQIQAALERGKLAAQRRTPPDRLYSWFGATDDLHPKGFLMTKLDGLTVMATHFSLRSATPDDKEIAQILETKTLLVSVMIFGSTPTFAVDSYMVLDQNGRTTKPVNVRFDGQASRTSVWPNQPAYRAKIVASFTYGEFDPRAATKLIVFPSSGGEVIFDLDLARFQ
jgi:hypothetical protein